MSHFVRTPIRTINVELRCHCGAPMVSIGLMLASMPPQYPHRCRVCGHEETHSKSYPTVEYEYVPEKSDV